jgi:hypothetical protein
MAAMAELTGSEILAKSLKNEGTDVLFFLIGGPMLLAESSCIKEGIRPLDVRHEQAARVRYGRGPAAAVKNWRLLCQSRRWSVPLEAG